MNEILRHRWALMEAAKKNIYTIEALIGSIQHGDYTTKYALNDTIPIKVPPYGTLQMQIVAFDADELSDGSGYAPITLVARGLLGTVVKKWADNGINAGGYPLCSLRTWLNTEIASIIQSVVGTNHLAEVKKSSYGPANTENSQSDDPRTTLWSDELVWVLSAREWGRGSKENAGPIYSVLDKSALGTSYSIRSTWSRKTSTVDIILGDGQYGTDFNTITNRRLRIGFCIK